MLKLKEIRESRKMTQAVLAARVGVAQGYLSSLENGVYNPSFEVLIRLAKALECKLDDLVDLDSAAS